MSKPRIPLSMSGFVPVTLAAILLFVGCKGSEVLAPAPSALDLDKNAPSCPGITSLSLSAGPAINVTYGAGTDDVTGASNLSYYLYMKQSGGNYDTVSPTKIVIGSTSTQITSGVTTGTSYTLFVACKDEAGNVSTTVPVNEKSISVSDTTPPSQITDLSVNAPTYTTVLLTWSPSDDGVGGTTAANMRYKIYASLSSGVSTSATPITTITGTTSYLHTGLNPNEQWYYRVVAVDAVGNKSADSNEANGTTTNDTTAPLFASGTSLATTSIALTSIGLSWSAASDNVTPVANLRYKIYRCSGNSTCNPFASSAIGTTALGATTYTDSTASASTIYVYGVHAVDYRANESTNTDKLVTATLYSSDGYFYAYPTLTETVTQAGSDIAIANVIGPENGYPDLIVGAPGMSRANAEYYYTGCVLIYAGTGVGQFSTVPTKTICNPTATQSGVLNTTPVRNFGFAVHAVDIDGDGFKDLVVSSPIENKVYIYRTTLTGTAPNRTLDVNTAPQTTLSNAGGGYFGFGICSGDLQGDGTADDLVIISPQENCQGGCGGVTGTGNIRVYLNSSSGGTYTAISNTPALIFTPHTTLAGAPYSMSLSNSEHVVERCTIGKFDPSSSSQLQLVVSSGLASVAAGIGNDGVISFYRITKAATPTFTFQNAVMSNGTLSPAGSMWGTSVKGIQLDTSATSGLAIGAPNDNTSGPDIAGSTGNNGNGLVYLYSVSTSGGNFTLTDLDINLAGGRDFVGNGVGYGIGVGNIFNHADGTQDIAVGAWLDDKSLTAGQITNQGDIYVYRNTNSAINTVVQQYGFDLGTVPRVNQEYGTAMCTGDINNDGIPDLVIGSPRQDYDAISSVSAIDIGAVYIYYGKSYGEIDFQNPDQIVYGPGDSPSGLFGTSCVVMDFDRDGKNDLIIGSPGRRVGANAGRGQVYVFLGSSGAITSTPGITLDSPNVAANQSFGYSLAKGDWDGNGYPDLAVGAIGISSGAFTNAGRAYVYWANSTTGKVAASSPTTLMPPSGAAGTAASVPNGTCGNFASKGLGVSHTLNNSMNFGYAMTSFKSRARIGTNPVGEDLVICAPGQNAAAGDLDTTSVAHSPAGVCYIYEGSWNYNYNDAGGGTITTSRNDYEISSCANNEIRHQEAKALAGNTPSYFGTSVTTGKWDSDNVDDLVICAYRGKNLSLNQLDVGACYAFYGASNGLGGFNSNAGYLNGSGTLTNSRKPPDVDDRYYNPNPETLNSQWGVFGRSVLLTDVNNNSGIDLLIGESNANHLSALPAWHGASAIPAPTNLGGDSGRVLIIRGFYQ